MWGPQSAMVDAPSANGLQGVVPRIFQMLFSNIQHVCLLYSSIWKQSINQEISDCYFFMADLLGTRDLWR